MPPISNRYIPRIGERWALVAIIICHLGKPMECIKMGKCVRQFSQWSTILSNRTLNSIKNVVDEEQMQRFPDVNSAEVLQRVSGVSVTRDGGEGRYVLVFLIGLY